MPWKTITLQALYDQDTSAENSPPRQLVSDVHWVLELQAYEGHPDEANN